VEGDGETASMERVRQYQVNRLRYYYAVATFDSIATASRVYDECNGSGFELSGTTFDLRFVPADMEFSSPASACRSLPQPDRYKPKSFSTTALQNSKVELTWDEEDQNRAKTLKEAFNKVDEDEGMDAMAHLIASASEDESDESGAGSEEEDEVEPKPRKASIRQYRELLAGLTETDQVGAGDMEITFNEEDQSDNEEEEEEDKTDEMTPWEKYLLKKKEKKRAKRPDSTEKSAEESDSDGADVNDPFLAEELGVDKKSKKVKSKRKKKKKTNDATVSEEDNSELALITMDSDDDREHFNFKDIVDVETKSAKTKKKWKAKKKKDLEVPVKDDFSVDVSDDRFSAIFSRPDYNIDPTDPNFKKTVNMEKILGEKQKRKIENPVIVANVADIKKSKLHPEISSSLKAVKNKWKKNAKKKNKQ